MTELCHEVCLDFDFKGERDYIQGPDIYNFVNKEVQKKFGMESYVTSISYKGFFKSQILMSIGETSQNDSESIGSFKFRSIDGSIKCGELRESNVSPTGRKPYNEENILKNSQIEDKCIFQRKRAGFSSLEEIVSLTKALHNKLFPSDKKWIFVQLELNKPINEIESLYKVHLKKNLGNKYTRSTIEENGNEIGWIGFSLI